MKQKYVGSYDIGTSLVDIYIREGNGGEFYFTPDNKSLPRIKIGTDYESFEGVLEVLLHEVYELALSNFGCRFKDASDTTLDHSRYLFSFKHTEFSEVTARCAMVLVDAIPDVKKEWLKCKKKMNKGA